MVKDHSDSERRNPLPSLFPISSKFFFIYAPSHIQDSTYHGLCYTSRGALAGTRVMKNVRELNMHFVTERIFWTRFEVDFQIPLFKVDHQILSSPIWLSDYNGCHGITHFQCTFNVHVVNHLYLILKLPTPIVNCFSFQPVLHDWCNKGRGVCYPVCGMMHIK